MYIHATDYKFKHIYSLDTLKSYHEYAERDIERCLENIERIKAYQASIQDHVQVVLNTDFEKVVLLTRHENYSTHKIEFFVALDHRPKVEIKHISGHLIHGKTEASEKFSGRERSQAIKYAADLAIEHHCKVEVKGMKTPKQLEKLTK